MTESTGTKRNSPFKWIALGCGVILLIVIVLGITAFNAIIRPLFITIEPDEVAVLISPYEPGGYREEPLRPGNHMLRIGEAIERYKVLKETYDSSLNDCNCDSSGAVTFSAKDDVQMELNYHVTYAIDTDQVLKLHMEWRHNYQKYFVIPRSKEITQEIVSQFTSGEIALTKKDEIEKEIFSRLESEIPKAYLILLKFKIDDVRLKQ